MDTKLPTIKEIAKRLNVSVSTVSRALNDHPRIGLRTKMRVQQMAKELNYEPNTQAIFFKKQRRFVIGVILPSVREEFFSQAISGIETAAVEHNYTILFGQSYDDPAREKAAVDVMKKQRVDGLLISLSKQTDKFDHLEALKAVDIPVVFFDRVPPIESANKVFCNLYKGTIDLIGWLVNHGFRRIALINGPDQLKASKERRSGYIDGLAKKKIKVNMQFVEKTDFTRQSTVRALKELLALKHQPDAIISFNDYVHMDVVQYAHQQGIKINRDVAFVSYANLPITGYTAFPPLVSLEQYPYRQGERAMEIMIKLLNEKSDKKNSNTYYVEEIPATLVTHQKMT